MCTLSGNLLGVIVGEPRFPGGPRVFLSGRRFFFGVLLTRWASDSKRIYFSVCCCWPALDGVIAADRRAQIMRLPWRSTNGSDSCTAAFRVPERVIYPCCGLFVAALTQILVMHSRVEVYTVGAAVGVDEVVQLQQVTSFWSSPKVLWASYIVVSPDSLSVRKLPGFSQSGGRKQAKSS